MPRLHYLYLLLTVSTVLSRVLSFVREVSLAWLLGGTPLADAFSIAMRIPTLWRRLLAEGSLSLALTNLCVRTSPSHSSILTLRSRLLITVIALITLAFIFKIPLITALAPDALPATSEKATELLAITLPYILFASLAAWRMARLHAKGHYVLPACAPLLYSLILTATALIAISQKVSDPATLLAYAVLAGGAIQWLIQYLPQGIPTSSKLSLETPISNDTTICEVQPDDRKTSKLDLTDASQYKSKASKDIAPKEAVVNSTLNKTPSIRFLLLAITTAAVPQLAFCIAGALVSGFGTGHMAALYYAERLIEVPIGLLAVTSTLISTPHLARLSTQSTAHSIHTKKTVERLLLLTLALNIPAAFGLIAIAEPAIRVLFEHGSFSPAMTQITSQSLGAYALSIPAYALSRPLITLCTNQHDGRSLLAASVVALSSIIFACFLLSTLFGAIGAPLGVTLGLWLYTLMLWKKSQKHYEFSLAITPLCWIIATATLSFIGARALLYLTHNLWPEWLSLIGAIFVGIILYASVIFSKDIREIAFEIYKKKS